MNVIETKDLNFSYNHLAVLQGIDLKVSKGSIFGFLGPNGAGKSTTIKAILGLLRVQEGSVMLFGEVLHQNRIRLLSRTGSMVESPSLYEHLSARRNLEIARILRKSPPARVDGVLEIVGLKKDAGRAVKQFSTGMKQRLSLAIALLDEPELLILDEPINGLDPSGIIEIRNLLLRLNKENGCTIFLSSHILDEIEKICTDVAVIQKGKLLYQGTTRGMLLKYTRQEKVRIETNDNNTARRLLEENGAITDDNSLIIPVGSRNEIAAIVSRLVAKGLSVYAVEPDRNDLEGSFLEILEEGGRI